MVDGTRSTTSLGSFEPASDWSDAYVQSLMQAQRMQLEAFISWQQSLVAICQEVWDAWACRWAGGVPIDG